MVFLVFRNPCQFGALVKYPWHQKHVSRFFDVMLLVPHPWQIHPQSQVWWMDYWQTPFTTVGWGMGDGTSTLMEVSFTTVWVVDNTDSGNGCGVVVVGRTVWFSCRRRSWPLTHPVCTVCVQGQCMGYCLYTYMYNVCVIIYNILYISVSPKLVCRGLTFLGYMDVCVTVYRCLYLSL